MTSSMGLFAQELTVPPVPADIQAPPEAKVFLKGHAVGTQNYMCLPSGDSVAWKLVGPQATLFVNIRWFTGDIQQQIMTHYSSANPDEGGTARPTWQGSMDTSAVWGKMKASSADPNYVAPGAIPWLLVEVVGSEKGPAGGELLTAAKFIHRVNTTGGQAPATGCSLESEIGSMKMVPYTADYFFYRMKK
jgi:hypothetical protein